MNRALSANQRTFLELAMRMDALRFGAFTLKSGRNSPYFFNAGQFNTGASLAALAGCYAEALSEAGADFDMLFGPAYKGIPLATAVACEFARRGRDLEVAFNRKEAKTHGEGGTLMGASVAGKRVLIVDDVITAGTAIREAIGHIEAAGGVVAGVVIALDRQEILSEDNRVSAVNSVKASTGVPVIAVATLTDLLHFAEDNTHLKQHHDALLAYRSSYGSN
jgi:orotate phosphoribosyltransferase